MIHGQKRPRALRTLFVFRFHPLMKFDSPCISDRAVVSLAGSTFRQTIPSAALPLLLTVCEAPEAARKKEKAALPQSCPVRPDTEPCIWGELVTPDVKAGPIVGLSGGSGMAAARANCG